MYDIYMTGNEATQAHLTSLKEYIRQELYRLGKSIQCHIKDVYNKEKEMAILSVANIKDNRPWEQEKIIQPIALGITKYIIEIKKESTLNNLLKRENTLNNSDKLEILDSLFSTTIENARKHEENIYSRIYTHFQKESKLNIDGFYRFRLQFFHEQLEEMVENAIDQYFYQQEHLEFIELLRYFVSIQEQVTDIVHVMYYGENSFQILNDEFNPIKVEIDEEPENNELDYDDLLVSFLITLSPKNIIIHHHDNEKSYLFTMLEQIFVEKLGYCFGCQMCISDQTQKT